MEDLPSLHMSTLFAGHLPLSAYKVVVWFALALDLPMKSFARIRDIVPTTI